MLNVTHLARTRRAHQGTLLTLQILQREAFLHSKTSEYEESESAWRTKMKAKSPTFMFRDLILRYETLVLIFVRAHRQRNFPLYVNVLEELISTPAFWIGSCELRKVGSCPYRRYEVIASTYQLGGVRE